MTSGGYVNVGRRELMAKARAITISIQKMTANERGMAPSGSFGEDYNRLLAAVEANFPKLAGLLPPKATIESSASYGSPFTRQRYAELDTFCEQLYQLLNEQPEK